MEQAVTFLGSAVVAFYSHHYAEKYFTRNWTRNIRLVIKGYQIHHSTWGVLAMAASLVFTSGLMTLALLGYGLGNIWQHKKTHNRINEKGLVFITRNKLA